MIRLPTRIWAYLCVPLGLVLFGTVGYMLIDGRYRFLDALYMTIITLATIGYGEVHPLDDVGKVFTIILIVSGVVAFAYSAQEIIRSVVNGELADYMGKQKMERAMTQLRDHIIVCGYGRMGRLVCKEFSQRGKPFIVIDNSEEELKDFEMKHGIKLVGDATSDAILRKAGVDRAHSLVTVMATDAENLFTTLSAHLLNPGLKIVARVEDKIAEEKLRRAGAHRVVSPYQIGGTRVADAVLKPSVVEFLDLTLGAEHLELQLEEVEIQPNSRLAGSSLRDSRLRAEHRIMIVAIKKKSKHMQFNPPAETILEAGDTLIAMGSRNHLEMLDQLARPKTA